jgi:hypothetical protein
LWGSYVTWAAVDGNEGGNGPGMELYLKLGTLPMKRYSTKEYKSIKIGDKIEIMVRGEWGEVKIWKLYDDEIPISYFGEYV